MTHRFIHACAGSGKTERVIQRCALPDVEKGRAVVTLTTSGQNELKQRLVSACTLDTMPDVMGWYSFLIQHVIRPYLPRVFPNRRIIGFSFGAEENRYASLRFKAQTDTARYFTPDGLLYRETLEELAGNLMQRVAPLVTNRLARIYEEILIDEGQDISRAGLDVIRHFLFQAQLPITIVADVRQSLIDSGLSSKRNAGADRLELLSWYRGHEGAGRIAIEEVATSHRFNQQIASFSDSIFPSSLSLEATTSTFKHTTGHDGVFLVAESNLDAYCREFNPVLLRSSSSSGKHLENLNFINFGISKGRTYDRVAIYLTDPMQQFITNGKPLAPKSACAFYVGVTRARYSVALVVRENSKCGSPRSELAIEPWSPAGTG